MTPRAPVDKERVEMLKQWLWHPNPKYYPVTKRDEIRRDIEAILDDYEKVKAEVEFIESAKREEREGGDYYD